jgi:dTDP-4-dehydrorhamnose reductase
VVKHWPRLALHEVDDISRFCNNLPRGATIIYCDAVCDVSKCEENPSWAREINIGNLQRTMDAMPHHARLVYISSDHVFGNDGTYDENSEPCPVSIYGAIRAQAEQLALSRPGTLLIRSGLPIGPSLDGKSGHLDWLRYRLQMKLPVTIIQDEARTAMPSPLLADRILDLAASDVTGIRHVTSGCYISRVHLATALKNHFSFPGELAYSMRRHQPAPHLGRIHITTRYSDSPAAPLPCPLEILKTTPELLTCNIPPTYTQTDESDTTYSVASFA